MASNMSGEVAALPGGMATPQTRSKLRPQLVVLDMLEARQAVGQGAHVAAALDVVLAAQRVDARAVTADVAGEQARG